MSWCEDYIDPFDRELDGGEGDIRCEDEDHWTCLYPDKCLMPAMPCRDECHTVEDVEAYYAEVEGFAPLQSENPSDTLRE